MGTGGLWKSTKAGDADDRVASLFPASLGAADSTRRASSGPSAASPTTAGSAYYGNGIYKSTDGGATWTNMGLRDGDTIGQIVIDPHNDDRVFAAVMGALHDLDDPDRGLFMTENGGASWTRVLTPREHQHRGGRRDDQQDEPRHHARDDVGQDPGREVARLGPHSYVYRQPTAGVRGRTSITCRFRRANEPACRRRTTSSAGWASTSATVSRPAPT